MSKKNKQGSKPVNANPEEVVAESAESKKDNLSDEGSTNDVVIAGGGSAQTGPDEVVAVDPAVNGPDYTVYELKKGFSNWRFQVANSLRVDVSHDDLTLIDSVSGVVLLKID
jgi:hypothetical protein